MIIDAERIDFNRNQYIINECLLTQPNVILQNLEGLRPPKIKKKIPYYDGKSFYFNPGNIGIQVKNIQIKTGRLFIEGNTEKARQGFDESHIELYALNGKLQQFELNKDTMSAKAVLSAKDRSGFELKKLAANIRFTPQIMEFSNLDLQTNKSRLGNYYAMQYRDFNEDFAHFLSQVKLTARFSNAKIHSDDIAFFAPELKGWNKQITLGGNFNGTIEDFSVAGLNGSIGANTSITGSLSMKGLPDINTTQVFHQRKLRKEQAASRRP